MKKTINTRRDFIKKSTVALTAFSIVPRFVLGRGYTPPSDQLTNAVIGVGGMGRGHFAYANTRVVAICDVDKNHLQQGLDILKDRNVKAFSDYRELIQLPEVDIVHIATPPPLAWYYCSGCSPCG